MMGRKVLSYPSLGETPILFVQIVHPDTGQARIFQMLVDTGATSVAMSADEARRMGINFEQGERGMGNTAIGGAMSTIDPQLGAGYKPASSGGTYTVNANPFASSQTTFTGGTTSAPQSSAAPATAQPQAAAQPAAAASQSFTSWAASLFN